MDVVPLFFDESETPVLLEIITNADDDALAVKVLTDSNRHFSDKDKMKNVLSGIIGEKGVKVVRKIIGK